MIKIINGYEVPASCSDEKLKLARTNEHVRDQNICFSDEGHKYFVKGSSEKWISTTKFIHDFFEDFNSERISTQMVNRKDFQTASKYSKYSYIFNLSKSEQVKTLMLDWDENGKQASLAGTKLHRNIELYYNDMAVHDDRIEFQYFLQYSQNMATAGWIPFRTEWLVYDEDYKLTGSIDMVFYHPEKKVYIIRDWKMSKQISKFGFGKKGKYPLNNMPDCNFSHYSLQQNVYKFFLEHCCGLTIQDMAIVIFHQNNNGYVEFEIPDLMVEVNNMLATRYEFLNPDFDIC